MSACPDLLAGPPSVPRARGSALILAALSLASPNATAAAQQAVPWAVEAPGAAGSRFGLGLDVFFERQESLRITDIEEEGGSRQGDPGLLNRKFDYRFDLAGVGLQLPVALPRLGVVHPTLVLQAATADVTFDFLDRTREGDSVTYEGRGPLFGAGLELTGALCRSCPWFAGASYRFQKLPSLDVERSPSFGPPGFEVLRDETRLSRDVHEASTRVGYGFPGNRVVSYLGARYRSTNLEIEDELRYLDPFRQDETSLSSRFQLESEVTLALAGVETRLGPKVFSRIETSVGDEDWGVLLKMVYLSPGLPEPLKKQRYSDIAARIRKIRAEYVNGRASLTDPAAVKALLDRTENELLEVLPSPEFAALQDSVREEFRKAREELGQGATGRAAVRIPSWVVPAALSASGSMLAQPAALAEERQSGSILGFLDRLIEIFENDDVKIKPCVKTEPERGARVELYPLSYREGGDTIESNDTVPLRRGLYAYLVTLPDYPRLKCPSPGSDGCRLDLLSRDRPLIKCKLSKSKGSPAASCIVTDEPERRWRCKDP